MPYNLLDRTVLAPISFVLIAGILHCALDPFRPISFEIGDRFFFDPEIGNRYVRLQKDLRMLKDLLNACYRAPPSMGANAITSFADRTIHDRWAPNTGEA